VVSAEMALKYVCWLVDVDLLYDTALGLYDFDLVMMVVKRSQKDPKEYLPFLTGLQRMESNYMRYTIDIHLRRYESALRNLSEAGDQYFEDCLRLIKEHTLYMEAVKIFSEKKSQSKWEAVYNLYGDHLQSKGFHMEAALVVDNWPKHLRLLNRLVIGDWHM